MFRARVPEASDSHLDLSRVPYGLYGVKYICLVSLVLGTRQACDSLIDASHVLYCYVLYGLNESTSRNLSYPLGPWRTPWLGSCALLLRVARCWVD